MKVIITGSSGFIGTNIIKACISNPSVTQIFALTRKPLPASISSHSKVKTIIVEDFMKLDDVLEQCAGASACIWYVLDTVNFKPFFIDVTICLRLMLIMEGLWA